VQYFYLRSSWSLQLIHAQTTSHVHEAGSVDARLPHIDHVTATFSILQTFLVRKIVDSSQMTQAGVATEHVR
jgi:hypothetical protein